MMEGKFTPFQGPVKDQSGAIKVAEGKVMPLEELMGFNWYVEGVEGTIPK
jgi:simple sugar transport system substrate-binding protein